jgi:hypothetical protein
LQFLLYVFLVVAISVSVLWQFNPLFVEQFFVGFVAIPCVLSSAIP